MAKAPYGWWSPSECRFLENEPGVAWKATDRIRDGYEMIPLFKVDDEEARDAARYRYLRVDDHWGEDAGPDFHGSAWGVLGEKSGREFDEFIDERMGHAQDSHK